MGIKKRAFILGTGTVLIIATILSVVLYSEWKLARLVPGGMGESFPTRVYAYPFLIDNGERYSPQHLIQRLVRLEYQNAPRGGVAVGQYRWKDPVLTIGLRGFQTPFLSQPPLTVSLSRQLDGTWQITDFTGTPVSEVGLEPELAAELSGPKKVRREPASWDDFPPQLTDAVIAVEDRRFFKHHGVDARAIIRAAWFNLRHRKNLQGGSTITQQLAKNFFLSQERTLQRKLLDVLFAIYMDFRYSKEQILTLYLNQIYMGQDGVVSVAGVRAAAKFYFGKELNQLNLAECATLAGIIRSPYRYNPFQNPAGAQKRRNTVLKLMLAEEMVSEAEYQKATKSPVETRKRGKTAGEQAGDNDYFIAEVIRQLLPRFSEDVLFRYGLKIYTSLDPLLQRIGQSVIAGSPHQAALVAIDPASGRVLALIGGKNFRESQFNRATQAHRQPGSAFKPFVYGAALEHGFTPASLLHDEPRAYTDGDTIWAPRNFDGIYHGTVTFRQSLANSINGATLDLAGRIHAEPIARFAVRLGIESPLEKSLAIALGASEVTLFELTAAYAPFANGGFKVDPYLVIAVLDAEDNVLEINGVERTAVLEPAISYLMTSLLITTVSEGTAKSMATLGWKEPAAGKTGTTNKGKDAWFMGYTSDLLAGVWVGDDEAKALNLTGAKNALPIWTEFMRRVYDGRKPAEFVKPAGIITARIDPASGLLARSGCPEQKDEEFIAGTAPTAYCPVHAGGFKGWLLKLFKKKPQAPLEPATPHED